MPSHLALWIDHKEAHIFHIHQDETEAATVTAPLKSAHHKHAKGSADRKEHPDDAKRFFHEIARSFEDTDAVLIVGPSTAKLEFSRYLHQHEPALEARVVGIETVDHPSDKQILAYAKQYFARTDRLR